MKPFFAFDINITEGCNLGCTYCIQDFEKKLHNLSDEMILKIKHKIDFLLQNQDFLRYFDGVQIFFWGGEPSTQPKILKDFLVYYENNPRVKFYMYSNGFNYNNIWDLLEKYTKINLSVQISYDGLASHNVARLDKKGKGSALKVKETIFELANRGINFEIHPTIDFDNLDKIADNYLEFRRIGQYLKKPIQYNPTIDYLTDHQNMTKETIEKHKKTITEQIKKIAKYELEFYKQNKEFSFSWLQNNRAICGAGSMLNAIDLDGSVVVCHGALYLDDENRKELTTNNINLDDNLFLNNVINNHIKFSSKRDDLPEKCKSCYATYCMKCNVTKFAKSKKTEFFEKYNDYPNQWYLCEICKHLAKIRYSLLKLI